MRHAVVALLLLGSRLALATPAHHSIDNIEKVKGGAKITVLVHANANEGYTKYSVGVTNKDGSRSDRKAFAKAGRTSSSDEVELFVPYGKKYKAGDKVRVISSWRNANRTHYWGEKDSVLVKLP